MGDYVSSDDNFVDPLTKGLAREKVFKTSKREIVDYVRSDDNLVDPLMKGLARDKVFKTS